ncbi:MAG: MFS transporter [Anaerolineae bacterium]|nr:MFS transporter [Anaerolineae bacterium]
MVMTSNPLISSWRVVIPVAFGTGLSLIGDTSLYAVLPTHTEEAGITLASVGLMLSANRFIRLVLNGPIGLLYDRFPRRPIFVAAMFIGALSTAMYALAPGFWPLLTARLLWGLAWAGIWVGGNAIILDVSQPHNRGRWVGIYQISFFLGASAGAILGGFLTDWLSYSYAMGIGAILTLLGAIIALLFLPETRQMRSETLLHPASIDTKSAHTARQPHWSEVASAMSLLGINRLVVAGILLPTLGLFLVEQFGQSVQLATVTVGATTLTGLALGANALISMICAPLMGNWSDRVSSRWQVAAHGLIPGLAGFSLLTYGTTTGLIMGVVFTAISSGSNQSLATTLIGDLSHPHQQGRRLGVLFTIGDLTSAVGPPLAYGMLPVIGLGNLYLFSAGLLGAMYLLALFWTIRRSAIFTSLLNVKIF